MHSVVNESLRSSFEPETSRLECIEKATVRARQDLNSKANFFQYF